MNIETFNKVILEQIERCKNTLCKKAEEYATEDRLHNFKVAATIQNCLPTTALGGMMAKHTVSVFDMLTELEKGNSFPIELWNEKIGDSINYLLLLSAMLREKPSECGCFRIVEASLGEELGKFMKRIEKMAFDMKCDIYGIHNDRHYCAQFDENTGVVALRYSVGSALIETYKPV